MNKQIIKSFGIHLKVADFDKSYKFYKDFGLKEIFAYGTEDFTAKIAKQGIPTAPERYRGVSFDINHAVLELGENHIAIKPEVFKERISSSKVSAMLDVDSVAEVEKICQKNSYEIAVAARDFPWGTRELVVRDPDGFILVFREFLKK